MSTPTDEPENRPVRSHIPMQVPGPARRAKRPTRRRVAESPNMPDTPRALGAPATTNRFRSSVQMRAGEVTEGVSPGQLKETRRAETSYLDSDSWPALTS